jgi:hypothetical protein
LLPSSRRLADWESSLPPDQQKQVQDYRQYEAAARRPAPPARHAPARPPSSSAGTRTSKGGRFPPKRERGCSNPGQSSPIFAMTRMEMRSTVAAGRRPLRLRAFARVRHKRAAVGKARCAPAWAAAQILVRGLDPCLRRGTQVVRTRFRLPHSSRCR